MFKMIFIAYICSIILTPQFVNAQKMPCRPNYLGIVYQAKMLDHTPPLSLNMPEDVMRAYLTISDLLKNTDYYKFKDFLDSQKDYSDTIRALFKNYFIIQDYNPVLLKKFILSASFDSIYSYGALIFLRDFGKFIREKSPKPILDDAIFQSDIIAQVKVTNRYYNNWDIIFEANIEDTLKGKVLPNHDNILVFPDSNFYFKSVPETENNEIGTKFIFAVPDENEILLSSPYDEFLVFCDIPSICIDTVSNYFFYYAQHILFSNPTKYIIPISKDGEIIDSLNLFGFGKNIPVEQWKEKLRNRISDIRNGTISEIPEEYHTEHSLVDIFPNPSSDNLKLVFNNGLQIHTVKIINSLGQEIKTIELNTFEGRSTINISIDKFPIGIYYCILTSKGNRITKSFVVLR